MPKESSLVQHPRYAEIMAKLLNGDMTLYDASRAFHCEYNTLWHHVRHGIQLEATGNSVIAKPLEEVESDDYVGILKNLITKLNKRVQSVVETSTDRPTAMIRELRGCISDLLVIEGRLSQQPLIQLNQITFQFNKLTAELATKLCPICQQKVLEVIEDVRSITPNE